MKTTGLILLSPDPAVAEAAAPPVSTPPPKPPPAPPSPAPAEPLPGDTDISPESMAEFDKGMGDLGTESAKKDAPAPPPKPGAAPPAKPDVKPTPDAKPASAPESEWDDAKITKASPKELRDYAKKRAGEAAAARAEVAATQKRVADLEGKITAAEAKGKDTTALSEQLATAQRERDEARQEARILKNEASPEFKTKYETPFHEAAEDAKREVTQLAVTNEDGTTRRADWQKDFAPLYALEWSAAKQAAQAKFGDDAPIVMEHYRTLQKLDLVRQKALAAEKANYPKLEQERTAKAAQAAQAAEVMYGKAFAALKEKEPDFQESPDDTEGNALLKKGMDEFSLVMRNDLTPVNKALATARVAHRAAAYPRLKSIIAKGQTRIAELEAQVASLKGSSPHSDGGRKGGEGKPAGEGKEVWADMPDGMDTSP